MLSAYIPLAEPAVITFLAFPSRGEFAFLRRGDDAAMGEEKALKVGPSGIEMAYERFGDPAAPPVLPDLAARIAVLARRADGAAQPA
jgi:hypothetical protein